jgi:hypothetical protein
MMRCPTKSTSTAVNVTVALAWVGERAIVSTVFRYSQWNSGAVGGLCLLRCYGCLSKAKNIF